MAKREAGEALQKTFFIDSEVINRYLAGVTESSNHKLVAPNSLVIFYLESVLCELIELPLPGLVLEQQIRFANAVCVNDSIVVGVGISLWNPDAKLMRVSVQVYKSESNLPVCAGNILLSLK